MLSAKQRLQFFNPFDVDNCRAMDPPEFSRIELCLHCAQGLPHHRTDFASMEVHIFIVGFYPIDFVSVQEGDAPARFDHEAIEVLRLVLDALQQGAYLHTPLVLTLGTEPLFCMFDSLLESRLIERL